MLVKFETREWSMRRRDLHMRPGSAQHSKHFHMVSFEQSWRVADDAGSHYSSDLLNTNNFINLELCFHAGDLESYRL